MVKFARQRFVVKLPKKLGERTLLFHGSWSLGFSTCQTVGRKTQHIKRIPTSRESMPTSPETRALEGWLSHKKITTKRGGLKGCCSAQVHQSSSIHTQTLYGFYIISRWWFQILFFIFTYFHPYLGKIPILTSIFFKWVETTN